MSPDHPPSDGPVNPRSYVAPRRAAKAAETRRKLLDAAFELYVAQGYAATTVDQIAALAGVSRPTVFVSVGGEPELLKQVRDVRLAGDQDPVPMPERAMFREVWDEPDQRRTLGLFARNMRRIHARAATIERVLQGAAQADAELRPLALAARRQRRYGCARLAASVASKGPLRAGVTEVLAGDTTYALAGPETFLMLRVDCRWTLGRYEAWLTDALTAQLLR
jgi:AcrR family transcriptional regulator